MFLVAPRIKNKGCGRWLSLFYWLEIPGSNLFRAVLAAREVVNVSYRRSFRIGQFTAREG